LLSQEELFMLVLLAADSEEFKAVEDSFKESMANAVIERIERVQNTCSWRKYHAEFLNMIK